MRFPPSVEYAAFPMRSSGTRDSLGGSRSSRVKDPTHLLLCLPLPRRLGCRYFRVYLRRGRPCPLPTTHTVVPPEYAASIVGAVLALLALTLAPARRDGRDQSRGPPGRAGLDRLVPPAVPDSLHLPGEFAGAAALRRCRDVSGRTLLPRADRRGRGARH